MAATFETFNPKSPSLQNYVDYYYLDIKPNNDSSEFQCFPHFNNTISLYRSHVRPHSGEVVFEADAPPLQIFTPIRQKILRIRQTGKVYRIVIVFRPFGVQQFFRDPDFSGYVTTFDFFTPDELGQIFSTTNTEILAQTLDGFLEKRFRRFENAVLEKAIAYIFDAYKHFSVAKLARDLAISRQHLNRVFQSHLGVSVKKFHEIALFRKTINKKLFEDPDGNFTGLAHEFHYNDQSHFNKIYKSFTQNSPGNFFGKGTILGDQDTFWHLRP